ncbi:early nodulin-like protein 17 isoform X2 [Primulina huaijiensis]|uniref:early nodulin-like protein 17 isoform X2 n=1 Tax=Primulina huaijiensis TaxID=1492673 RepID=UPI003CC70BA4
MEGLKLGVFRLFALVVGLTCAAVMLPEVAAVRFIVGGNMGWSPNVNYAAWVDAKNFYNGDWLCMLSSFFLIFRSTVSCFKIWRVGNQMNVLEVNRTEYESCNSDNFLHNWTTGTGRDVVPLNVTRTYYFISGKGFCFSGMKLAVNVEDPPAPSPSKSTGSNRRQQFPPLTAPPTVIPDLSFTPAPSPSKPGGVLGFSPANGPSGSVSGSSSSCSLMNRLSCLPIILVLGFAGFVLSIPL